MSELDVEQNIIFTVAKYIYSNGNEINNLFINNSKEIDWNRLSTLSEEHRIFPIIYKSVRNYVPIKIQDIYDQKYLEYIKMNALNIKELNRVLEIAKENDIDIILIKGLALAKIIYDDINMRGFCDIDLLVKEKDMEKLYYLLTSKLGYTGKLPKKGLVDKPIYYSIHELKCQKNVGERFDISVEIKRNSSAIPLIFIGDFFNNVEDINIGNIEIKTSNLEYSLLHMFANLYNNCETKNGVYGNGMRFRDVIDLYMFIKKYNEIIVWDEFKILAEKYEITHKVYFSLLYLISIYGNLISDDILELFNPQFVTYKYFGNSDGSMNYWKSDFTTRLFNNSVSKKEFINSNKIKIYNENKYPNYDLYEDNLYNGGNIYSEIPKIEIYEDKFKNIIYNEHYQNLEIDEIGKRIEYLFTFKHQNIYLHIIFDSILITKDDNSIFCRFIDNSLNDVVLDRIFQIWYQNNLQIRIEKIEGLAWEHLELGEKTILKIRIPLKSLNMNLTLSQNNIFCYLDFRKILGIDEKWGNYVISKNRSGKCKTHFITFPSKLLT
jgi:Uncharacterised nucleotidyltransferase